MSYIEDETGEYETWQYPGKGRVQILRLDAHGQRRPELISGGRRFQLTPRERRMNQELAANDKQDIFSNGTVVPLSFSETTKDAEQFSENPNFMKDEEIGALFKAHAKTFEKRVASIDNITLISRLIDASQEDSTNATVRQVELLKKRAIELDPALAGEVNPVEVESGGNSDPTTGIKAVTPK